MRPVFERRRGLCGLRDKAVLPGDPVFTASWRTITVCSFGYSKYRRESRCRRGAGEAAEDGNGFGAARGGWCAVADRDWSVGGMSRAGRRVPAAHAPHVRREGQNPRCGDIVTWSPPGVLHSGMYSQLPGPSGGLCRWETHSSSGALDDGGARCIVIPPGRSTELHHRARSRAARYLHGPLPHP